MKLFFFALGVCCAAIASASPVPSFSGVGTSVCTSAPNTASPSGAVMLASGSDSVVANDLTFDVTGLPPTELGILVAGRVGPQTSFRDGLLCLNITPGVLRLNTFVSTATGQANVVLDHNVGTAGLLEPGQTRVLHVIYRDCMSQNSGINVTNGIQVTFTP